MVRTRAGERIEQRPAVEEGEVGCVDSCATVVVLQVAYRPRGIEEGVVEYLCPGLRLPSTLVESFSDAAR